MKAVLNCTKAVPLGVSKVVPANAVAVLTVTVWTTAPNKLDYK
jgi:hypothetical protein